MFGGRRRALRKKKEVAELSAIAEKIRSLKGQAKGQQLEQQKEEEEAERGKHERKVAEHAQASESQLASDNTEHLYFQGLEDKWLQPKPAPDPPLPESFVGGAAAAGGPVIVVSPGAGLEEEDAHDIAARWQPPAPGRAGLWSVVHWWYWRVGRCWVPFSVAENDTVEAAWSRCQSIVKSQEGDPRASPPWSMRVDLPHSRSAPEREGPEREGQAAESSCTLEAVAVVLSFCSNDRPYQSRRMKVKGKQRQRNKLATGGGTAAVPSFVEERDDVRRLASWQLQRPAPGSGSGASLAERRRRWKAADDSRGDGDSDDDAPEAEDHEDVLQHCASTAPSFTLPHPSSTLRHVGFFTLLYGCLDSASNKLLLGKEMAAVGLDRDYAAQSLINAAAILALQRYSLLDSRGLNVLGGGSASAPTFAAATSVQSRLRPVNLDSDDEEEEEEGDEGDEGFTESNWGAAGPEGTEEDGFGEEGEEAGGEAGEGGVEEEDTYEIEQVCGIRMNMALNRAEFLCRWSGYESEDDSWEPYENLTDADRHIEDYKTRSATDAVGDFLE